MSIFEGTLELKSPLTKECWDKLADVELENTERIWFTTPSGKKVEFIKADAFRWTLVSERLPEDGQIVLFCDIDNDIMVGYHVKGRPNTHFSQDGTYDDMKNVWAWMPLPKPYEPQQESEET